MTILTEAADRLELSHLIPYDSLDRWKCELCGFIGKTSGKFTHSDACLITRLRASSQPMADSGWRMVPAEPTEAMLKAGGDAFMDAAVGHVAGDWTAANTPFKRWYRAMLAAAPPHPGAARAPDDAGQPE